MIYNNAVQIAPACHWKSNARPSQVMNGRKACFSTDMTLGRNVDQILLGIHCTEPVLLHMIPVFPAAR